MSLLTVIYSGSRFSNFYFKIFAENQNISRDTAHSHVVLISLLTRSMQIASVIYCSYYTNVPTVDFYFSIHLHNMCLNCNILYLSIAQTKINDLI